VSLSESTRGHGLMLGKDVQIGEGVSFGAYVVVHEGVRIGDGCTIEDHVVLGKRPRLAGSSMARGGVGALELGERRGIAEIISFHVRDGHFENLAGARGAGEGRVRAFHAHVHLAAEETQALVAQHGAGKQSGFEQNLESVADAEDHAAGTREAADRFHHRGKAGDGAGAQVIAEGKAAGDDDGVEAGDFFGLVPDEFDRLVDNGADGVASVIVAIRTGELNDSEFHGGILAHLKAAGVAGRIRARIGKRREIPRFACLPAGRLGMTDR